MANDLDFKVNKFAFTNDKETEVFVDVEIEVPPPGGAIVFLYAAVGAEEPMLVAEGRKGALQKTVSIATTRKLLESGPGNRPVTLMVYACYVYNAEQAVAWIKANAANPAHASTLYAKA